MSILAAYEARLRDGSLTDDPAQRIALEKLERVRVDLMAPPPKSGWFRRADPDPVLGLYMWGGVGRGKSMLMDLATEQIDLPKRRMHFHAFMQHVHDRLDAARKTATQDAIQPVADELANDLRLLAFDEMQITDVADAMIVGRLFEALFARGVVVITTSNRPPENLYKNGLNRQIFLPFIDLLQQRLEVHHLQSEVDYRQEVLAGSPSYFTPINADSRVQMDQIWRGLTAEHAAPHVIRHKGRDIQLPAFHGGCARATFFDLCGTMLGPGDYLRIAEELRVLVLDDIPILGRSNFNEAKRFVTLIDALYEAKVRLIASAAAQPEYLYQEGEGAFEFERTASRLREMQGAEWGDSLA